MSNYPTVILQQKKARPFFGRHPWVYLGAIDKIVGEASPGCQVRVVTFDKEFIAYGLYNPESNIRVRLYSWDQDTPISESLVARRVEKAIIARTQHLGLGDPRGACRLCYSESDGLSGLIIDRYADVCIVQFTSMALAAFEKTVVESLQQILNPRAIYRRVDHAIAELEKYSPSEELLAGDLPACPFVVTDAGLDWWVDPTQGQKTGLFLDQRDNRMALCQFTPGKDVLDVCCYAGAFGISALKLGQAKSMTGIDSSGPAIHLAQKNAELNDVSAEFIHESALDALLTLHREKRRFDVVVCDPPKFARSAGMVESAKKGYEHLNRAALDVLKPGGILCTCSCSGHISQPLFLDILASASQKSGRPLQILAQLGQAKDHPISVYCLETAYLKCVIARAAEY